MAAGHSSRCGWNAPRRLQAKIARQCELCCRQKHMCLWRPCRPSSRIFSGNQAPRFGIRHHGLGNDGAAGMWVSTTWLMTGPHAMNVFSMMLWLGEGAGALPVFRYMLSADMGFYRTRRTRRTHRTHRTPIFLFKSYFCHLFFFSFLFFIFCVFHIKIESFTCRVSNP